MHSNKVISTYKIKCSDKNHHVFQKLCFLNANNRSENCMQFLQVTLLCTGKEFMMPRKSGHSSRMHDESFHCSLNVCQGSPPTDGTGHS